MQRTTSTTIQGFKLRRNITSIARPSPAMENPYPLEMNQTNFLNPIALIAIAFLFHLSESHKIHTVVLPSLSILIFLPFGQEASLALKSSVNSYLLYLITYIKSAIKTLDQWATNRNIKASIEYDGSLKTNKRATGKKNTHATPIVITAFSKMLV